MKLPKVIIILTTYNRGYLITETLNSISSQTFENWECYIIDDNSIDNTFEKVNDHLLKDSRFSYYLKTDTYSQGLPDSRNMGLDLIKKHKSHPDFVQFFDDDDIIHPNNIEYCVRVLSSHKTFDFCSYEKEPFTDIVPTSFETSEIIFGEKINSQNIDMIVTQEIGLASCTVMWSYSCFRSIRFNKLLVYAEEWECYIRIIIQGANGIQIKNKLYFNRKHNDSQTSKFFSGDKLRIDAKKTASLLILNNLNEKSLLNEKIVNHFIYLAAKFKDVELLTNIKKIINLEDHKTSFKIYLTYYRFILIEYKRSLKRRIRANFSIIKLHCY